MNPNFGSQRNPVEPLYFFVRSSTPTSRSVEGPRRACIHSDLPLTVPNNPSDSPLCFIAALDLLPSQRSSFLFSVRLLYEINKLSGMMLVKSESKTKRH
ncbi:hypothetical protein QJS10_CPB14g00834 [Acorus calamus]|uniref:Uncharacterized protein n=1 Tax=Acorus calamus TaxID=4465 RepID=A0AAV9DEN5_ACOCL|nr:hypothetical protein QJS10_CPB14g00834 [Acorus calamus]